MDQVKYWAQHDQDGADTGGGTDLQGDIVVGKFVDRERPTWLDAMTRHYTASRLSRAGHAED